MSIVICAAWHAEHAQKGPTWRKSKDVINKLQVCFDDMMSCAIHILVLKLKLTFGRNLKFGQEFDLVHILKVKFRQIWPWHFCFQLLSYYVT